MSFHEQEPMLCCTGNYYYFLHFSVLLQAVAGPPGPKGERVSHYGRHQRGSSDINLFFPILYIFIYFHIECMCIVYCQVQKWRTQDRADITFLWLMQGLPGQTLPGVAGERGLPGEKVSLIKPSVMRARSWQVGKCAFPLILHDTCCLSGCEGRQRSCWHQRRESEYTHCRPTHALNVNMATCCTVLSVCLSSL